MSALDQWRLERDRCDPTPHTPVRMVFLELGKCFRIGSWGDVGMP
jgi:hypothetical protein